MVRVRLLVWFSILFVSFLFAFCGYCCRRGSLVFTEESKGNRDIKDMDMCVFWDWQAQHSTAQAHTHSEKKQMGSKSRKD